ncbi:putative E3 ubiquitin-protein ligase [Halotydeus destructor]|nr:putative E3 ubiquitin-protein ligase [Halotydeus destructor]
MLRDGARFSAFKKISQEFRHDTQPADSYYKRCIELFGKNNFHRLFGELIVLLPDVRKQNELLAAHEKYVKYSKGAIPKKSNHNGGSTGVWIVGDETMGQHLVVCPSCQQVLAQKDGAEHMSNH